jgi:glycosyltransferase involved in cell wall biosynthesis
VRARQHLARIADLEGKLGVDHVLIPWLLDEPVPAGSRVPRTVFVLDRNWAHFPGNFPRTPAELDHQLDAWLAASHRGIAISRAVADDVSHAFPSRAPKLRSIPLAASSRLTRDAWEQARSQSGPRTFYYPATVALHKGHAVLLDAAAQVRDRGGDFTLAFSGHGTDSLAIPPALASRVRGVGYASSSAVDALYLRAETVVLPSLFEGFGLPLAEAISWGARVICTDLPSFREQIERLGVHNSVEVVPPGDAAALAAALQRELDRPPATWEARRQIADHSAAWTWEHVSRAVLAELAP